MNSPVCGACRNPSFPIVGEVNFIEGPFVVEQFDICEPCLEFTITFLEWLQTLPTASPSLVFLLESTLGRPV